MPESHGPRGVWRLDLELPKQDILRDLDSLSFINIPQKKPAIVFLLMHYPHRTMTKAWIYSIKLSQSSQPTV